MTHYHKRELGDDYYILYRVVQNGFGGLHPVDITLYRDDGIFVREITDSVGNYIDLQGVADGKWKNGIKGTFLKTMQFVARISNYVDGLCCVAWMIKPDRRHYTDDGEIWLYVLMDQNGKFITEFSEDLDTGKYDKTMRML